MIQRQDDRFVVSAIISAYNSERFMSGRLQDLVDQTLFGKRELEIVVIDSNSSQNERAIVEEFMKKYKNIQYSRTENKETVYGAWNRGIRLANGSYIINANCDDRFSTNALECMANELNSDESIDLVYGDWMVTKVENDSIKSDTDKFVFEYPDLFPPLFFYFQITSHAPLIRKEVFDRIGLYDDRLKVFGDREFMFRFSVSGLKAKKIPRIVGLYLESSASVEHSENSGGEEFAHIREMYCSPQNFAQLFGYDSIPDKPTLANLYAATGSLGKDFYRWNGRPISDLPFAARLLGKALELDSRNMIALNNLGIILCLLKRRNQGLQLFQRARRLGCAAYLNEIQTNFTLAKKGSDVIEEYLWIKSNHFHGHE